MKRLHTDNGGKYVTLELQFFLREQEIIYETSTPYIHQQNGCATTYCLKRHSQCNLKHTYLILVRSLLLQLQVIYIFAYLFNISNENIGYKNNSYCFMYHT